MKLMLNINRKSYSLIVTVIILMSSCRQQSLPNSLEAINIINKDRPIELDIYDIVDSISYIPLETSEKCLLGELQRTKRDGDFYFVEDTKGLFVFGKDGRFLNEIGHKGNISIWIISIWTVRISKSALSTMYKSEYYDMRMMALTYL